MTNILGLTLGNIGSILGGIITGCVLCIAIILLVISKKLSPEKITPKKKFRGLSNKEFNCLIKEKEKQFKNRKMLKLIGPFAHCKNLCLELIEDVARKFKRKSKTPMYELSISESLKLVEIVALNMESLFESPILKPFRGVTINFMIDFFGVVKSDLVQNSIKVVKKTSKFAKIYKWLRILNPTTWIGMLKNLLMNFVIKKYCILTINLVGVEAYKVYSKSIFIENEDALLQELKKYDEIA